MRYRLTIPTRINLLDNPPGANEGDFATISTAITIYAGTIIEDAPGVLLEIQSDKNSVFSNFETPEFNRWGPGEVSFPLAYDGKLDLITGAVNVLIGSVKSSREGVQGKKRAFVYRYGAKSLFRADWVARHCLYC